MSLINHVTVKVLLCLLGVCVFFAAFLGLGWLVAHSFPKERLFGDKPIEYTLGIYFQSGVLGTSALCIAAALVCALREVVPSLRVFVGHLLGREIQISEAQVESKINLRPRATIYQFPPRAP